MVKEVCGHQITPTTLFIALAFSHCLTQNSTFKKTLCCLKPHHHRPRINPKSKHWGKAKRSHCTSGVLSVMQEQKCYISSVRVFSGMKLCGSCVASVRRLQYLSLVFLCHQKKAFPLRFWLPGHKLQYRTFIVIIIIISIINIINNYLLYIMHHVVVIYSCIPTLQDYQTWVSVIHCAWHPLSHHYLSVLATSFFDYHLFFFSWKRSFIQPCLQD